MTVSLEMCPKSSKEFIKHLRFKMAKEMTLYFYLNANSPGFTINFKILI